MFKTKLEVDRHVSNCLKKINNETERNLRCFSFSKLYFQVGDYEQAHRYVMSYLSVKPKSAEGYLLLAKSLEKLGKLDAALEAYKNSLQMDPKQNKVVLKVCELLASDDVELDLSGARYFCDLAQTFDPNNPIVHSLREKLITKQNDDPIKVTELLLRELETRPLDVYLRIRLLKHFLQNNMVQEAYKHATMIENKYIDMFCNNLSWYQCFNDVLLRYEKEKRDLSDNWEFWLTYVSVLDRLIDLTFANNKDAETAIFTMDQILNKANQFADNFKNRNLVSVFLRHFNAQLHFYMATMMFKINKLNENKDISNYVLPVLFVAYDSNIPDLNSIWLIQSSDYTKKLVNRWYQLACYRNSQTGHIINNLSKDRKSLLLEKAAQYSVGLWREKIYKSILFVRRDLQIKISTSFFVANPLNIDPLISIPYDLSKYDEILLLIHPDNLNHYVWIGRNVSLHELNIRSFEGLPYSSINLNNCAAESLNQLDLYAFIYCTILSSDVKQSTLLPISITDSVITVKQKQFLETAYKLYKKEEYSSDSRVILIKGIEVVRCISHHGLDVKLLVTLGDIFEHRTSKIQSEMEYNLSRAELYYKTAIPLLEKILNNEAIIYSNDRLFNYKSNINKNEAESLLEKCKLFVATRLYKKKNFEPAIELLTKLKDPYASYYQYEIYKEMSNQTDTLLLTKARDCLYLTLDRLRDPANDINHPLNLKLSTEITQIEQLIYSLEMQPLDNSFVQNYSSLNASTSTPLRNIQRQEVKPSPERLDAQIRQIISTRDSNFAAVTEQMKAIVHTQNHLLDKLNTVVNDLKTMKIDIQNLKSASEKNMDDAQNLLEGVQEIRKDLNEVKKNDTKTNQLSDEDLYVLDPDYGVDYNVPSNIPNYAAAGRLPNPNHIPAYGSLMYPGLYAGLQYGYGLNFAQPPFIPDQQLIPTTSLSSTSLIQNQNVAKFNLDVKKKDDEAKIISSSSSTSVFGKSPPVNVVITTSDPLPNKNVVTTQPILSVTIPPQHVKSNFTKPPTSTTVSGSLFGAPKLGGADKSIAAGDASVSSIEEPNIHFEPIVPLPDEVPVVTGEENETELFSERAKLFRQAVVDGVKEWKDRGVGNIKILKNNVTGKFRLLMRSDQVLKICANHFIQKDMIFMPSQNNDKAFTWIAQDFSDGKLQVETFCVKFKTTEEANRFKEMIKSIKDDTVSVKVPTTASVSVTNFTPTIKSSATPIKFATPSANSFNTLVKDSATPNKDSTAPSSTSLGGFVFTGTPSFKPVDVTPVKTAVEKPKETTPNPFATFVFGNQKANTVKDDDKKTFSPLVLTQEKVEKKTEDLSPVEEFVPNAEFKPVIPLPDLVEVKTGEEGCEILFEGRTKLFRMDTSGETKEWKERGLGTIKVLKDDSLRLLMRRDQVHKVCVNHRVLKDMIFMASSNPKAILWKAQDFSEETLVDETFTAQFKTPELANEFLQTIQKWQKLLDENNQFKKKEGAVEVKPTFSDAFKPKPGSWECKDCYTRNDANNSSCVSCNTPKDGVVKDVVKDVAAKPSVNFNFNWTPQPEKFGFGDAFKPKPGSWECQTCLIRNEGDAEYCVACNTSKDGTSKKSEEKPAPPIENKWSFGIPAATSSSSNSTTSIFNANKSLFTTPSSTSFSFGSNLVVDPKPNEGKDKWVFGNTGTSLFGTPTQDSKLEGDKNSPGFAFGKEDFEFKQRTPRRISTGPSEESDGSYVEEEDNIYFKPIIPLPDKVQVKTGEEEEDVVFSHRAKLFRFVNGEWKERGIGDVKILRNKTNNKLRVVMRREQVFKICMNHALTKDVEYKHKDERSLLFTVADFSEEEIVQEMFCLRFKNAEVATDFLNAAKAALGGDALNKTTETADKESDDEVIFVSETQVTPEEEEIALKLGLPRKFLAYKQLPDCNCEQCKKDDEYLKDLFADDKKDSNSVPTTTSSQKITFNFTAANNNSSFGSFSLKPAAFSPASSINSSIFASPMNNSDVFKTSSGSIFGGSTNSLFSTPPTTSSSMSNIFSTPLSSNNVFGASNVFNTQTPNIFSNINTPSTNSSNKSFFTPQSNIFGSNTITSTTSSDSVKFSFDTKSIFSSGNSAFGNVSTPDSEKKAEVLKCDPKLSFASLAAEVAVDAKPAFSKSNESFTFSGVGAPVFGSLKTKSSNANVSQNDDNEDANHNDDYDPHYDPIIALPDEIVVTTGEENEDVVFNERAKLYRYVEETKEWKERGVGQMKILKHREKGTYRFLLRREQVHKVVLNQLIPSNFDLQPMTTSDKAWTWAGYNYTDDGNLFEKLAVRFKNVELANKFRDSINNVLKDLKEKESQKNDVPVTVEDFTNESGGEDPVYYKDENDYEDEYGEEEEEEEEDEDDDEGRSVMFMKNCLLSELDESTNSWRPVGNGEIQVYYDSEMYGSRIQVTDTDRELLSSTIIGVNTLMDIENNECRWKAFEWVGDAKLRNLKAVFENEMAAQEFHSAYIEGLNYAQEIDLVDDYPQKCEPDD